MIFCKLLIRSSGSVKSPEPQLQEPRILSFSQGPRQTTIQTMTSLAASLASALPKPKYTGDEEEIPIHAQQRGPRIVGAGALDDSQIVLKVSPRLHSLEEFNTDIDCRDLDLHHTVAE